MTAMFDGVVPKKLRVDLQLHFHKKIFYMLRFGEKNEHSRTPSITSLTNSHSTRVFEAFPKLSPLMVKFGHHTIHANNICTNKLR